MLRSTNFKLFVLLVLLVILSIILYRSVEKLMYVASGVTSTSLCVVVFMIIKIFNAGTSKVAFMFDSLENNDFTFRFTDTQGTKSEKIFNSSLNKIRNLMIETRKEIIKRESYYELIMERSQSGFLVIDDDGRIYKSNSSALSLLGLNVLSHISQLKRVSDDLPSIIESLMPGQRVVAKIQNERMITSISLNSATFYSYNKKLKIIVIDNISDFLEQEQIESWMRLTRVLTHEIMNTITPISSLSSTLLTFDKSQYDQIRLGLDTIHSTSKNLISFVDSYRKFTRIPQPDISCIDLCVMFERIKTLLDYEVTFNMASNDMHINADESLITQVLVNLIKNGYEASGNVMVDALTDVNGKVLITVTDTGDGISPEVINDIFTPFFTTKEGGSGIGLSLSMQIMRLHGGSLILGKSKDGYTQFTAKFS
ncbi:MAG: ATP-binding protein [Rikenellaceae bacterium]